MGNWKATSNEYDCQKECQNYGSCNYWTYNTMNGKCHMKSSDSGRKSHNGAISGPKHCPGKLPFYFSDLFSHIIAYQFLTLTKTVE